MYQDYKDLLSAFNAHGVRYPIVGGYAVIFHAQPRFTRDIDIFIKADPANALATHAARAGFGASLAGIRAEEFADRSSFFRFGEDPHGFDVLPDGSKGRGKPGPAKRKENLARNETGWA
jgi:hypothetical protein